jgi:hypothetical protein
VNVLSRNMLDICDLIRFFAKCFKQMNPKAMIEMQTDEDGQDKKEVNIFNLMVDTLAQIGNKILNTDPL